MKFHTLLGAAIAASAIVFAMQGCSSSTDATTGIKCTPGNYVFCRCADRAEGTKLCKEDGASFEACSTNESGECAGGEDLTDPGTGTPVDPPPVKPPPQEAGPPPVPIEACPGQATAVTPGAEIVINGDTTGATDDAKGKAGACSTGGGGPDHIYHLQPTGTGALSIKVKGEGALNPLAYVRSTCTDEESQSACSPPLGAAALVQTQTNVVSGRDYYLVIDGASGSAGKYALTLKLTTGSFCGDGTVDTGEACDDGNKVEGDGCSNSCRAIDGNPAGADCTKPHVVHMWKGATVSGTGSNAGYANTFDTPGSLCTSTTSKNASADHVYEVTARTAGNLKVTLTPTVTTLNAYLIARKICAVNGTTPAACANDNASPASSSAGDLTAAAETMTIAVQNNEKVYVDATGTGLNGTGTYTIKFELP